jgi:hypothetical protein
VNADSQPAASGHNVNTTASGKWETVGLAVLLFGLLGVTAISLSAGSIWQPRAPARAPWCLAGQTPRLELGFAELARHLGDVMGEPTECEHGDTWTGDTRQETTTGVAVYRWCTNTPTFTRGSEHWMLAPNGVVHWTDGGPPPTPQPVVRVPDLRQPCSP